jgi:hypothetical protein
MSGSCPSCGRQPNRFVNGLLMCEGGHEWQGKLDTARAYTASSDVVLVPITVRGVEYALTPVQNSELRTLLCLIALNNPEVDAILKAFNVVIDIGGKRVFPTP